jgi:hypothetical protein
VYARVLNAYARVSRVAVSRAYVWVLNTYAWVLISYARVSRVAVSRARESGEAWGGSQKIVRECSIVYIPRVPVHGSGEKNSPPTHI